ncbi:MAG: LacI family DNA-binding transcriptional regulator [Rhodococcus sp. (in: high G+C Gram-positive bacteria)]|uniref:LacI family DNA-binding transcriptional regulator n=1 Tax=Rhodococcus navarretei TaxID=3128981 RepID=A0ABU9CR79_9NOCA|nr:MULTISPECIES: LacI family DNA-binding transcriptional regulator [unclassified Rhodococcus (in: high G+C Gram-positive bacteria)]MCJ0891422.1 LacI family DNA-binding transcriptional regulator [Rhodococcus sp. ARC_M5]MCJ0977833.1 LacI family DNA-binding transcriptional regulator [Rhodococcus sp. ARC_M12]MDZ7930157.1 LacI family DNA-binding transcriptional regulator [Rhodococcus sp. (in: high G+C Gram-positive bacteria)]
MARSSEPRRQATLASIAAELKVSRTTVSNAYNRPDQLSPELRERVLQAAKRRGYAGPDPVARSLRTRKAGAIGLLLTEALSYSFRDPAAMSFLAGLAESCEAAGQGLLLIPAGAERDDVQAAAVVQQAGVDGFVVYSVADDDPYLAAVRERHLPIVVCDQPRNIPEAALVAIDDRGAMKMLAAHLISQGHEHLAVLCMRLGRDRRDGVVPPGRLADSHFHVQRERIAGVQAAMIDAGLDPDILTVVERFDHTVRSGHSAAAQALQANRETTALLCTTDVIALGALNFARVSGIDVPSQLSVTGFDGISDAIRENLTTVRQDAEEKGRRAGKLVLSSSHSGIVAAETLPTELFRGRTAGPPPKQPPAIA